jgi:hypothetical protein
VVVPDKYVQDHLKYAPAQPKNIGLGRKAYQEQPVRRLYRTTALAYYECSYFTTFEEFDNIDTRAL